MAVMNFFQALKELADEKNIPESVLQEAIEEALTIAYKKKFATKKDIKVEVDKKTGSFIVKAILNVVADDDFTDADRQCPVSEASYYKENAQIGDLVDEDVTPDDSQFGRIAAQAARQIVTQKLKEAEKMLLLRDFREKIGQIISGKVLRVERGVIYVEFKKAEAPLPQKEQIPGENFRPNDRIRCIVKDADPTQKGAPKGAQFILSRSSPLFIERLFEGAVPEIQEKIVEIKSVARDPGSRVKIAVASNDQKIDPVGACVGLKGSRIKGIIEELNGERIDIVKYSSNPVEYITNALNPAKIISVNMADDNKLAVVVVSPSQQSLAIGKEGQNVKLASRLTGIKIDIKTEKELDEAAPRASAEN
ncbi:MAG: transcription termination factor NusA [Candidatus Riflebacteria bacterium]|nr:transcription termination factor NusA [Candidatus Riflebacteria bacterium]